MLEAALDADCSLGPLVATGAAQGGHLHVLQWLHARGCKMNDGGVWHTAARSGHLEV